MSEISRRQFAAYAVAVVLVVLLGGRALRAGGAPADGGGGGAGAATAFPAQAGSATSGGGAGAPSGGGGATGAAGVEVGTERERVVVHVAGLVERPGVYELGGGARIQDALRKAGGGRARADLDALNLAAKLTDGQQIVVTRRSARGTPAVSAPGASATGAGAPAAGGAVASAPVNVNTAGVTELEALDGVGPAIAAKIVDWRTQNGPFRTVDDLGQVSGIGPKKLEAMRDHVVT